MSEGELNKAQPYLACETHFDISKLRKLNYVAGRPYLLQLLIDRTPGLYYISSPEYGAYGQAK